jgi:hypothetical protein
MIASQPAVPGTAQLMVRLRGERSVLSNLTFTLCNNEHYYLQPDGGWSPAPHWFTIDGGYPLTNGSGFHIGPSLLDPLLENASQVQIQLRLNSGEMRSTTLQLVRDELLSSNARGHTDSYGGSSVLAAPEPAPIAEAPAAPVAEAVVEPAAESVIEPAVESVAEPVAEPVASTAPTASSGADKAKRGPSRLPWIIAAAIGLIILIVALLWFTDRSSTPDAPTPPRTAEPAAPAPAEPAEPAAPAAPETADQLTADACSAENLARLDELEFVQNCTGQQLDSDGLLAVIQAAKEAKKCGVAQRLYANRAQGGDSKVAIAYAGEYDPEFHHSSECFKDPDPDTAAYWYETALQTDPDNPLAKRRLEELGK